MRKYVPLSLVIFTVILSTVLLVRSEGGAKTMYVEEAAWIKVHISPVKESQVIARVKSGDLVTILAREETWSHIRTARDEEGWVMNSSLTEERPFSLQVTALISKTTEQSALIAQLTEENNALKKHVQFFEKSETEFKQLKDENLHLKDHRDLLWVAVGAGVILAGWILGLITGSFYRRGKSKYRYSID